VLPTFSDLGRHRPAAADGGAEIAAEGIADEAPVLHEDRLVQVELGAHAGDLIGIGHELREHHLDRSPGTRNSMLKTASAPEEHRHHGEQAPRDQVSTAHEPAAMRATTCADDVAQNGIRVEVVLRALHVGAKGPHGEVVHEGHGERLIERELLDGEIDGAALGGVGLAAALLQQLVEPGALHARPVEVAAHQ
jgi:hypothetical protein